MSIKEIYHERVLSWTLVPWTDPCAFYHPFRRLLSPMIITITCRHQTLPPIITINQRLLRPPCFVLPLYGPQAPFCHITGHEPRFTTLWAFVSHEPRFAKLKAKVLIFGGMWTTVPYYVVMWALVALFVMLWTRKRLGLTNSKQDLRFLMAITRAFCPLEFLQPEVAGQPEIVDTLLFRVQCLHPGLLSR